MRFVNERCRVDYEAMPAEVRESADQAIDALQNARPLPPADLEADYDKRKARREEFAEENRQ